MTNSKVTKKALLASAMSLILCFTMLLGTTYAWFTDSVTSGNNHIVAGNLDVDVYTADGESIQNVTTLFDDVKLWEPGAVAYENLTVANLGTLALKYQLSINYSNENTVIAADGTDTGLGLSDVLKVAVVEGGFKGTREDAAALSGYKPMADWADGGYLTAAGTADDEATYGVVIYWEPSDKDNDWNVNNDKTTSDGDALHIDLGVNVTAWQKDYESDSFGKDYDKSQGTTYVSNVDELTEALANGEKAVLSSDITITADQVNTTAASVPVGLYVDQDATLDLNGHTLAMEEVGGTSAVVYAYNAALTIEGEGTISHKGESGFVIWARNSSDVVGKGVVNIYDATIYGAGAEMTLLYADCNVFGDGANFANYASINVYGGNYVKAESSTNPQDYMNVKNHGAGRITLYGGTYNWDLGWMGTVWPGTDDKNYITVADGYKTVQVTDGYIIVPNAVNEEDVVESVEELTTSLTAAAAANSGDTTIAIAGDIDLSDVEWKPISVDGYHGAGVVTVLGNGNTITGLDAPLFAGGFAGNSGIVIKDLTIADSTIAGGDQGGGAFIDSADSMHVITLENCHVVNSTISGERAGGLIGWCSGYAKLNDGPVKANVTISNCSVVDCTVIGNGSAGGIAGHPGASDYTWTTIENCIVKNVDVVSHETGSWRTGAIVGTANNGHIIINNVTVEDVTLTQNGVAADTIVLYGRFVPSGTGTLVIDGVEITA